MPFLPPNQQRQGTEGTKTCIYSINGNSFTQKLLKFDRQAATVRPRNGTARVGGEMCTRRASAERINDATGASRSAERGPCALSPRLDPLTPRHRRLRTQRQAPRTTALLLEERPKYVEKGQPEKRERMS